MDPRKALALILVWAHIVMTSHSALAQEDILLSPTADVTPPKIEHVPATQSVTGRDPVIISATVKDDSGVNTVTLFYRSGAVGDYKPMPMERVDADRFEASIPAQAIQQPNLEYYIQAVDGAGNTVLRAGRFFPLKIAVVPEVGAGQVLATSDGETAPAQEKKSVWGWVIGALAVGAVAALAAGGGGGGGGGGGAGPEVPKTGSLVVTAPAP
jgi:hypothetical protein